MVSETIDLAIAIGKEIKKLVHSGKGIYKSMRGTRGKMRQESAETIVQYAASGNTDAIKIIYAFKPFDFLARAKDDNKIKDFMKTLGNKYSGKVKSLAGKTNNEFLDLRELDWPTMRDVLPDILNEIPEYKAEMAKDLKNKLTSKSTV